MLANFFRFLSTDKTENNWSKWNGNRMARRKCKETEKRVKKKKNWRKKKKKKNLGIKVDLWNAIVMLCRLVDEQGGTIRERNRIISNGVKSIHQPVSHSASSSNSNYATYFYIAHLYQYNNKIFFSSSSSSSTLSFLIPLGFFFALCSLLSLICSPLSVWMFLHDLLMRHSNDDGGGGVATKKQMDGHSSLLFHNLCIESRHNESSHQTPREKCSADTPTLTYRHENRILTMQMQFAIFFLVF